jgi:hypothetical protein
MTSALRKFANAINPDVAGFSQQKLKIDWSHPLAKNLSFAVVLNGREVRNLAGVGPDAYPTLLPQNYADPTSKGVVAPSGAVEELSPYGPALKFPSTDVDGKIDFGSGVQVITETSYTILVIANPSPSNTTNETPFSQRIQGGSQVDVIFNSNFQNGTVGGQWCMFVATPGNIGCDSALGLIDGRYHVFVGVQDGTQTDCFQDGVRVSNDRGGVGGLSAPWNGDQRLTLGGLADISIDAYALNCTMPLCLVWNGRALSDDEIAAISAAPYQVFAPDDAWPSLSLLAAPATTVPKTVTITQATTATMTKVMSAVRVLPITSATTTQFIKAISTHLSIVAAMVFTLVSPADVVRSIVFSTRRALRFFNRRF